MQKKKNTGMIAIIAVILVALGAGGYFFTQKSDDMNTGAMQETAKTEMEQSPNQAANVETAAGNPSEEVKQPEIKLNGDFKVEPGNPVVARVDGKDITRVDVYRFIQTMPANMQQLPATQVYPVAMEQVINTRLVQNKADSAGVENTPEFKREMDIVRQQIMRNLFLQQQVDAKISEADLQKDYKEFLKGIPDVKERRARHILLDTEEKAKAAIERLKKDDADFAKLAAELSVGPTKSRGGDLGYFAKKEMVPEFSNAAFSMKKGEISETPVKTQFGWHVIKVEDERDRPKPTFEQYEPSARAEMRREIMAKMLDDWRKDAKVEQFDINGKPLKDGANVIGVVPEEPKAPAKKDG